MKGEPLRRSVLVTNPEGFHLRPVTAFAQRARQFLADVTVVRDDRRANGKSPMELMLVMVPQGSELVVEVSGEDAAEALEALAALIAAPADVELPDPPAEATG
jgi:phosphotransferase system HPr (HPr) family protein